MWKKIFRIVGIIAFFIGCLFCYMFDFDASDFIGVGLEAIGFAFTICSVYDKSAKNGKVVTALTCFAVGGLFLGFSGVTKDTASTLALSILGLIGIIAGILCIVKKEKKIE